MVDIILDKAGQKGTGKWTQQIALDLAVPIPTIGAALDARVLSSMKEERVAASKLLGAPSGKYDGDSKEFINAVQDVLYASKVCSYAQGMSLIRAGSKEWNWNINLREMARIWTGGCIIRARLLADIMHAFDRDANVANLLVESEFTSRVLEAEKNWRKVVQIAAGLGIPAPAFSSSLAYFDSYRSAQLPQNLTQAQRDFFGAHTYQRADRPEAGFVHTEWQKFVHKK
jgi:6-phosphogluconate dehydrogenase